jgi:hypothetical protein
MMAIANDKPMPTWRNFMAWSAAAALVSILIMGTAIAYLNQDPMGLLRPTKVTAELGLAVILSMAVAGYSNRKRPFGPRTFRNFLVLNVAAAIAFLLVAWAFTALARTGTVSTSEWVAAATGATLLILAVLGTLVAASARTNLNLIEDESAAEEMRERGRLYLYSFLWMGACGALLIGLSLAGPGGLLPVTTALAGALVLIAALILLGIAARRLSDELGRTLSRESASIAFHLVLAIGGGWAVLAHLGLVTAPAPLDWLTLFTVLMFGAGFIAAGRRRLLTP